MIVGTPSEALKPLQGPGYHALAAFVALGVSSLKGSKAVEAQSIVADPTGTA